MLAGQGPDCVSLLQPLASPTGLSLPRASQSSAGSWSRTLFFACETGGNKNTTHRVVTGRFAELTQLVTRTAPGTGRAFVCLLFQSL